jgi:ubiquinone/menaquinone biosynthesis C-methylase UbiE
VPEDVLEVRLMDAQNLDFPSNTFTHVYMNFGLAFVPDADRGAAEIYRTLVPGGTAFVSSWEHMGYLPLLSTACKTVRPNGDPLRPPISEEWRTEKKLVDTFVAGGFAREKIKILRKRTFMGGESVDALVESSLIPFSMALEGWSDAEKVELKECIKSNMSEEEKRTVRLDMDAMIAVAEK